MNGLVGPLWEVTVDLLKYVLCNMYGVKEHKFTYKIAPTNIETHVDTSMHPVQKTFEQSHIVP